MGAVAEIDDVEQAENDRQAQAEQGIERAVDQPQKELAEQGLWGDSQELEHDFGLSPTGWGRALTVARTPIMNGL
ncbi:hypothetical protein D3C72_2356280 [compost metagenome]